MHREGQLGGICNRPGAPVSITPSITAFTSLGSPITEHGQPMTAVFVAPYLLATVVEVTAEAGVAPDARCAESMAKLRAVHLKTQNNNGRS